jgi:Flp pilus assembly protein TadB
MPLSEDEQRILRQIEQELRRDPDFSRKGYRVSRRRLVLLVVALVAGLAMTILALTVNFLLAFAGFVGVLVIAVALENEVRIVGREKLGSLPVSAWLGAGHKPRQRREQVDDD